jgi:hypothetical protein
MTLTYQNYEETNFWVPTTPIPESHTNLSKNPSLPSDTPLLTVDKQVVLDKGWCSDCAQHVPLLDEAGTEIIKALYTRLREAITAYKNGGLPSNWAPVGPLYGPVFEAYVHLTKQPVNFNKLPFTGQALAEHLVKHSVKEMGPPCGECGHHLAAPKAIICTHCGEWQR